MIRPFNEFELDDSLNRIDFGAVHAWLAGTYWSPGISRQRIEKGARHSSLVVGAYVSQGGEQAGYLRIVSDRTRFAYVSDVFVAEPFRKRGLAKAMMRFAMEHPEHQGIDRWFLATSDAHAIYKALGFSQLSNPQNYLVFKPAAGGPSPEI